MFFLAWKTSDTWYEFIATAVLQGRPHEIEFIAQHVGGLLLKPPCVQNFFRVSHRVSA